MRIWGGTALLAAALAVGGCSVEEPEPVPAPPLPTSTVALPQAFDPELAPALAALTLVPADATTLTVTDFDQVRLQLGEPLLTSASPPAARAAFWRRAEARAPLLSTGRLRPVDARLLRDYGFTQDDVAWEAGFSGPSGQGWVARLRDDLDLTGVRRAVGDGVGPLAGAELDEETRLVSVGAAPDAASSWAQDDELGDLVAGAAAGATYVERACVPAETALGADAAIAATGGATEAELDDLETWSVSFGGSLATVRLGPSRDDVFDRLRVSEALPSTGPALARGFTQGVADPVGGRIGFAMADPAVAARLTLQRRLPFAACAP
ncbi:hypothetical protein [Nocardioides lijunqiniae]|uniref:hypothetical protein n=1 Tax=Nocardioides lijunqiniae TaxID=2760832 RepID=UPI001878354F|nr:hypothetical protein [Nocardioides lijunqiniae]